MARKVKVTVRPARHAPGEWIIKGPLGYEVYSGTKAEAVDAAVDDCHSLIDEGYVVELVVYNRNGRVAKGGHAPRTYPRSADPRRYKG